MDEAIAGFASVWDAGPNFELELKHGQSDLHFEVQQVIMLEHLPY